ncbi:MAG: alanine--glyoxylate aminotransferase family protein [Bacteroidales bacterium]|nr:alanine--glyoxylate aminotransferase family protein [Bacteroidales bacterium]
MIHSYAFPGDIDPALMEIGSRPFLYMRTQEFSDINLESERILLDLIHCTGGRTIIYTGSGTGAMSAVVENYVSVKGKAFVIDGGSFGHRWWDLCRYYGIEVVDYKVQFAKDIDYDDLETQVAAEKPAVFLCQHHETSSGQLFNLRKISDICHKYGVSLVVDVISTFLAEPLSMDEYGIDICITSTQKGLNIPPGLSVLFFSAALNGFPFAHRGYYWDFEDNFSNFRRGQTPFSPATILFLQLHARLKQLQAQGGEDKNIAAVHHRCEVFRTLCREYGWEVPAEVPSSAITGFQTRDTADRFIFRGLIDKYDTYIMPGGIPGFYRVSHMGLQTDEELRELAARIHEFEPR